MPNILRFVLAMSLASIFFSGLHAAAAEPGPRYRLQQGDVLEVKYRFTPEFNQTVTIQPDGFVALDMLGEIKIAGLTVDELYRLILEKARQRLQHPEVTLTLKEFLIPYFVVSGEVRQPGKYDLRESLTVTQGIMMSGGVTQEGQPALAFLFRKVGDDVPQVRKLDLKREDPRLEPGDMLMVPENTFLRADHLTLAKLVDARAALFETDVSVHETSKRLSELERQLAQLPMYVTAHTRVLRNHYAWERLNTMLVDFQNQRTKLLARFHANDRLVKEIEEQIQTVTAALERAEKFFVTEEQRDLNPLRQQLEAEWAQAKIQLTSHQAKRESLTVQVRQYQQLLTNSDLVNPQMVNLEESAAPYKAFARTLSESSLGER